MAFLRISLVIEEIMAAFLGGGDALDELEGRFGFLGEKVEADGVERAEGRVIHIAGQCLFEGFEVFIKGGQLLRREKGAEL